MLKSCLWSKSRIGTRVQRLLHLLDRMVVAIASRIGSKKSMWVRRHSGRLLIRSVSEGGEEDRKLLSALSIILTLLFLSSLSSSVSHSPLPSLSFLSFAPSFAFNLGLNHDSVCVCFVEFMLI